MQFASRKKGTVELWDGETRTEVRIRALSDRSLDKAMEARQAAVAKSTKVMGPEVVDMIRKLGAADAQAKDAMTVEGKETLEPLEARLLKRYAPYDRDYVLTAGIEGWSATWPVPDPDDPRDGATKEVPVPLEVGIPDMLKGDAEKCFRAILELSLPPLDPEAEAGKGSGPSIAS